MDFIPMKQRITYRLLCRVNVYASCCFEQFCLLLHPSGAYTKSAFKMWGIYTMLMSNKNVSEIL